MGLPLERWARQASLDRPVPEKVHEDLSDFVSYEQLALPNLGRELMENQQADEMSVDELLGYAMRDGRTKWRMLNGELRISETPKALEGIYAGLVAYPPAQNLSAAAPGAGTNTLLWTPATYTPIPANSVLTPEAYRLAATGLWSTGATASPTATWGPSIGTAAGTALGASSAMVYVLSITNAFWYLLGDITIRTGGTAGTAYGMFTLMYTTTAGPSPATPTATNPSHAIFGNTAQTAIDFTVAQGLAISTSNGVAGTTHTPTQIHWMSWN